MKKENWKKEKWDGEETIKLSVDFYADGFRSGIIEVPVELKYMSDEQKRIAVTEKLVQHLPKRRKWWEKGSGWYFSEGPFLRDDVITIIRAKIIKKELRKKK